MKILLNDNWTLRDGNQSYSCAVPCSVTETLFRAGAIPDPYDGENETVCAEASERDYVLEKTFSLPKELLACDHRELVLEGVDTLAEISLNGETLGCCDNMHRVWRFPLDKILPENNLLRVTLRSPSAYVRNQVRRRPLWGVDSTMPGYPYLRKAHYMFGWDWGPVLPDMGLWRDVSVQGWNGGRILDVYWEQRHMQGRVTLICHANTEVWDAGVTARCVIEAPDGQTWTAELCDGKAEIVIDSPALWWTNGLGAQPLYRCRVELQKNGQTLDSHERRIGLRTLTVSRERDKYGRAFCFMLNGVKIFAMGANYIPEDQLLPRITRERTSKLLQDCKDAHFNMIRVWGGGFYPDGSFYDWCDENGLLIWQDCMFACSAYLLTPGFEETVRAEIRDNALRLRNHPSLAMWCGNNEIESAWEGWGLPEDPEARAAYPRLFEDIIPGILKELDPQTFYWPSSPSTGGHGQSTSDPNDGDSHYWAVWHNFQPIEAFRKHSFRFCSEYGFESLPDMKTIRAFAREKDLDLCGNVMQAHQKCTQGNEKIMYYLAQMVNYPKDFERLIYCSQLVQADCIRSNVEHMRRLRGRCMGSLYWQVNDSNPVISWSSIDVFGRWKALHYQARKFYAPILLSCDDRDPAHPSLWITNDTGEDARLDVVCRLRDHTAKVLREWHTEASSPAFSAVSCLSLDLESETRGTEAKRARYLEYTLYRDGEIIGFGTTLFVRPKAFAFLPAKVEARVTETADAFAITLTSDVFAKSVWLSVQDTDCVFSDNAFDLHGGAYTVTVPKEGALAAMSARELRSRLRITHYGQIYG